jgi:excisionase family DNA binding protein
MARAIEELIQSREADVEIARESSRMLAPYTKKNLQVTISANGVREQHVTIPASAVRLLVRVLTELAQGNAVTFIPVHAILTTQEAAELLNVSRPHLCKLVDKGDIPHHRVGSHRRIRLTDLLEYKRQSDHARAAALQELVALGQAMESGQD